MFSITTVSQSGDFWTAIFTGTVTGDKSGSVLSDHKETSQHLTATQQQPGCCYSSPSQLHCNSSNNHSLLRIQRRGSICRKYSIIHNWSGFYVSPSDCSHCQWIWFQFSGSQFDSEMIFEIHHFHLRDLLFFSIFTLSTKNWMTKVLSLVLRSQLELSLKNNFVYRDIMINFICCFRFLYLFWTF